MIYGRDDMKRYGQAVALQADKAMHQLALNLQMQLATNPTPDGIEGCLETNLVRFRESLAREMEKLEKTL